VVFFAYLRLKAARPLQLGQIVDYQKVFYAAGINLLPMPVSFHPWVIITGLYVAGIAVYIAYLQRRVVDRFSSMLFFMSVLGIGLFAYYQGRSHEFVLTIVAWPAVVIGFAMLDRIRRACAAGLLPRACSLAMAPIVVLSAVLGAASLINLPAVVQAIRNNWPEVESRSGARLKDGVSFIRKNSGQNPRAIILSLEQSTYFGETNMASAIDGPGLVEIVFRSDFDRFNQAVVDARDVPVFAELDDSGHLVASWRWLLNSYTIAECSPLEAIARIRPFVNGETRLSSADPTGELGCARFNK